MITLRTPASSLALGTLTALILAGSTADAGDYLEGAHITTAASRCTSVGAGFVDLGDGTCLRPGNHIRVLGARRVAGGGWAAGTASSATLRSEGPEFMRGVGASRQLRVRSGLQTLNPY